MEYFVYEPYSTGSLLRIYLAVAGWIARENYTTDYSQRPFFRSQNNPTSITHRISALGSLIQRARDHAKPLYVSHCKTSSSPVLRSPPTT